MKTTSSNATTEQQATTAPTETTHNFGVMRASNVFINLWNKAADHLTTQELEWFSHLSGHAAMEADNLAEVTENLGCLINSDKETGCFESAGNVATLLFNISHQIDTIHSLIHISCDAEGRLKHPDIWPPAEKSAGQGGAK